jgi:N utilization substance protein B
MKPHARHKARQLALQAIYQWQLSRDPIDFIEAQFLATANPKKIDLEYFSELLREVTKQAIELDSVMLPFLDRKIAELDQVELAVLRLAIFEMKNRIDIPYKVVIDEALKLTKIFGSVEGFKYVNGILDKVAHTLRKEEIA